MVLKLLLEWVVIRSSCTAALLRKRLPDASVSACSKGACAGDRHAAGWRGVAAQQPANLPSHRAEFNLFLSNMQYRDFHEIARRVTCTVTDTHDACKSSLCLRCSGGTAAIEHKQSSTSNDAQSTHTWHDMLSLIEAWASDGRRHGLGEYIRSNFRHFDMSVSRSDALQTPRGT